MLPAFHAPVLLGAVSLAAFNMGPALRLTLAARLRPVACLPARRAALPEKPKFRLYSLQSTMSVSVR